MLANGNNLASKSHFIPSGLAVCSPHGYPRPRQWRTRKIEEKRSHAPKGSTNRNLTFLSYSHEDEKWKDRLLTHLAPLQSQKLLTVWEDRQIGAGSMWKTRIGEAIESSSIAILLITANFLRSEFIMGVEVPRLLERRQTEGIEVIPILVKPCCWEHVEWLNDMNFYPRDAKALSCGDDPQVDMQLAELASILMSKVGGPLPGASATGSEARQSNGHRRIAKKGCEGSADSLPMSSQLSTPVDSHAVVLKLSVTNSDRAGTVEKIVLADQERLQIGRSSKNDLVLGDDLISKFHAEIRRTGSVFLLADLGSRNFTIRNGERLRSSTTAVLGSGDVIEIGKYRIECDVTAPDDDQTHFAGNYVNPFVEGAALLAEGLKLIEQHYDQEATSRRLPALREAFEVAMRGRLQHHARKVVGELLPEVGSQAPHCAEEQAV